jgi:hypothetical protein
MEMTYRELLFLDPITELQSCEHDANILRMIIPSKCNWRGTNNSNSEDPVHPNDNILPEIAAYQSCIQGGTVMLMTNK